MKYIAQRLDAYAHPGHVLDGAKSIVMLATNYGRDADRQTQAGQGAVARYACGADYHDVLHRRMKELLRWIRRELPTANGRGVVDSAPLLEREFAQLAGLGWVGKNTMLLNRELGSYFFLSAVLLDRELEYDVPLVEDYCGSCRACLDACPTDAFVAPYVLDSRRCISYLTIELGEAIPAELRSQMGDWVFGCDVCQEVCPWNQHAARSIDREVIDRPELQALDLVELFTISDDEFRARFRATPLWRAKRRGLLRNAAIALGNQRAATALQALTIGLHDSESIVRGASAWALGQIDTPAARQQLEVRLTVEGEPAIRDEIHAALKVAASREVSELY